VNYVASYVDRLVFLIPPHFSTLASGNNGSESVSIFCGSLENVRLQVRIRQSALCRKALQRSTVIFFTSLQV
jgi:hypothetical protein